ncbi:MAG: LPS-assembly protein LptD [Deltaproteobacteria bacterium]|nr:LPS-assembly protein LptD [Deltaproteobacteria bacterium]
MRDAGIIDRLEGPLVIEAGELVYAEGQRRLLLRGGVRIAGSSLELRADWMEIHTDTRRVVLAGGVRLVEGERVVLCERLELDRRDATAVLSRATLLVKQGAGFPALGRCRTASGLLREGINALRFDGQRWVKRRGRYTIEQARFTPCDCGPDEAPSWELRASEADVVPGERAWLSWPVLAVKGLPVMALPVAYLPLRDRQTGLLFPQLSYSGRDGVVLSESLFVTLGDSADATLTADWFQERGFRERLELRATPWRDSWARARAAYIDDAKAGADPLYASRHRASAELDAWADGPGRSSLCAVARLYSDSDLNRDFASEMSGRATELASSSLVLDWRGDDVWIALDAAWHQDLRLPGVDLFGAASEEQLARWGMDPTGDTIQRLGALSLRIAPVPLFGWPVYFDLEAEGANLSSIQAAWRDWGLDGVPDQRETACAGEDCSADDAPAGGEGDGELGDGELRRAFRLLVEPGLSVPIRAGRALRVEARASHRQLVYLPHGPEAPRSSTRGVSFASLRLESEIARSFETGSGSLTHSIAPAVMVAGAWRGLQSEGARHVLDLDDRLLGDALQLVLQLDNELFRQAAGAFGFERLLGLRLWQSVDLRAAGIGQAAVELDLEIWPARAHGVVALDWRRLRLAECDLGLSLGDRRGDALGVSYLLLPSEVDPAGRPLPFAERSQREPGLPAGLSPAHWRAMGSGLHVLGLTGRLAIAWGLAIQGGLNLDIQDGELNWYGGGVSYASDCRCWSVSVTARMLRGQDLPDLFFFLDLAQLGSAGGGTSARF